PYWVPELTENGEKVDPHGVTVYYGSRLKDPTRTVPFPEGFRMIVGDAKRQGATPKGGPGPVWCAGHGGGTGASAGAPATARRPVAAPTATGRSAPRPRRSPTS